MTSTQIYIFKIVHYYCTYMCVKNISIYIHEIFSRNAFLYRLKMVRRSIHFDLYFICDADIVSTDFYLFQKAKAFCILSLCGFPVTRVAG